MQPKYRIMREVEQFGRVAQLGEHLLCKQGVRGSNPLTSTKTSILANPIHIIQFCVGI